MKAVISNAKHPEYGQVTIPLPIPAGQYEHVLDLLDALKIGDTLEQDCQVDELPGCRPILKRLEGSSVNIDELDYLAKRLESFIAVEDAQFQGMAVKLGIHDIRDFIDLAFCCQEATVITDFSDLEKIGKDHIMTVNGGCMPSAEHDRANCRLAALDLICNHEGYGREKLNAAVLLTETSGIISLCRLAENIDMFDFVPNIHTAEEYGRYMIQQSGRFVYDKNLEGIYDYARYGEQLLQEQGGQFNDLGYVAYKGTIPLEEFLLHGNKQQGPEMGSPC